MTRIKTIMAIVTAAVLLPACSSTSIGGPGSGRGGGNNLTNASRLVTLNQDGSIPDQNFSRTGKSGSFSKLTTDGSGRVSGFAYQYGRVEGRNQFLGVAGVAPNSDVGSAPTEATATYSGDYALTYANRGEPEDRRGTISLEADFRAGELEGSADGLVIDGTINGRDIGGKATFRGVEATLDGLIGSERAIGAFAGRTANEVLVGGFDATTDPDD